MVLEENLNGATSWSCVLVLAQKHTSYPMFTCFRFLLYNILDSGEAALISIHTQKQIVHTHPIKTPLILYAHNDSGGESEEQ